MKTVMFNPYTGTPRHPSDIASDPEGLLILEPGAPLRAAAVLDKSAGTGPAGTYGCACVSRDMRECIRVRYRGLFDNLHDHCECLCHHWNDDDAEDYQF